jgi:hypothetical protein
MKKLAKGKVQFTRQLDKVLMDWFQEGVRNHVKPKFRDDTEALTQAILDLCEKHFQSTKSKFFP